LPEVIERLSHDSPLGAVLAAGLRNLKSSRYVMKEAIEEAGRSAAHDLERFLTTWAPSPPRRRCSACSAR